MSLEQSRASVAGEGGGFEPCSDCTVASPRDNSDGSSESVNEIYRNYVIFLQDLEKYEKIKDINRKIRIDDTHKPIKGTPPLTPFRHSEIES